MYDDGSSAAAFPLRDTPQERTENRRHLRRTTALGICAGLVLIAVVLLSRRMTGAATSAPPAWAVLCVSGVGFALGITASLLMGRSGLPVGSRSRRFVNTVHIGLSGILPGVIGLILAPPGATAVQMGVLTLTVLAVTALSGLGSVFSLESASNRSEVQPADADLNTMDHAAPAERHWMSRRMSEDGCADVVEGIATATFLAGQKQAVLHVPFCPPFAETPQVDCEPAEGDDVRWKVAVAAPYGIRIDVTRRSDIDHPADIPLSYFASAPHWQHRAA